MKCDSPDHSRSAERTAANEQGETLSKRRKLDAVEVTKLDVDEDTEAVVAAMDSGILLPVRTRFLRISVSETRSVKSTSMQIGEVGFRCKGETLQLRSFTAASMYGASPLSEGPERVLRPPGKFLDFNFRSHGRSLLTLAAPSEFDVDEFALKTATDSPSRDPVNLTVEGSLDNQEWQLLLDTHQAGLATPAERRAWTSWLPLRALGPAKPLPAPPNVGSGARFFCCPVSGCQCFEAKVEGYLVEGKLLNHMLRQHPRSAKTQELSVRLRGGSAVSIISSSSSNSSKRPSINASPTDAAQAACTQTCVTSHEAHTGKMEAETSVSAKTMDSTRAIGNAGSVACPPLVEGFSSATHSAAASAAEATGAGARTITEAPPSWTPGDPPVTPQVRHDSNLDDSPRPPTPLSPSPLVTRRRLDQQQLWKERRKEKQLSNEQQQPEGQHPDEQQPEELQPEQEQQQQQQQQHKLSLHSVVDGQRTDDSSNQECLSNAANTAGLDLLAPVVGELETLQPHISGSSSTSQEPSRNTERPNQEPTRNQPETQKESTNHQPGTNQEHGKNTHAAIPISGLDMLQRYPPIEATVEERLDVDLGNGFDVRLRDNSGSVWVAFRGEAASVFGGSGVLRTGNCVRLEGYDLMPTTDIVNAEPGLCCHKLLVNIVHAAVRITTLHASFVRLGMLGDVAPGKLVNVEADVGYLGPLRVGGPPGLDLPGAPSRALLLRDGAAACALVLHSRQAEDCDSDLLGCRVRVYGTRFTDFKGKHHLSGWEHVERVKAKQQPQQRQQQQQQQKQQQVFQNGI